MRCKLPSFLWPYIEGVSHNPYEHFDSEENLERYETEQKQREWERKIRKQKRVVEAFKRTVENSDPSVVEESKVKLQRERKKLAQMRKDYKAFSEANGLKEQTHRLEIANPMTVIGDTKTPSNLLSNNQPAVPAPKAISLEGYEFDGNLEYYENDPNLSQEQRISLTEWESREFKYGTEYAIAIDAKGNVLGTAEGDPDKVYVSPSLKDKGGTVISHSHIRESNSGILGGTFSYNDMGDLLSHNYSTIRAVSVEGVYSLSKLDAFDALGFNGMAVRTDKMFNDMASRIDKAYDDAVSAGEDKTSAWKTYAREYNNILLWMHNEYKAYEAEYGYYYTLEAKQ